MHCSLEVIRLQLLFWANGRIGWPEQAEHMNKREPCACAGQGDVPQSMEGGHSSLAHTQENAGEGRAWAGGNRRGPARMSTNTVGAAHHGGERSQLLPQTLGPHVMQWVLRIIDVFPTILCDKRWKGHVRYSIVRVPI